mgnify:CR=1 FL=1
MAINTSNIAKHQKSEVWQKGRKRRENEKLQDKQVESEKVDFFVNEKKLEMVSLFNYLGCIISQDDDDTICIEEQIKSARGSWNGISKILKEEGASANIMAKFYLATVQAILLYEADS